jgi:hypothetical protein
MTWPEIGRVATEDRIAVVDAAVSELVAVIQEMKTRPIRPRIDHHGPVRPAATGETAG